MKILFAAMCLLAPLTSVAKPLVLDQSSVAEVLRYCKEKKFHLDEEFPVNVKGYVRRHVFSTGPLILKTSSEERVVILDVKEKTTESSLSEDSWLRFYFTVKVDDKLYVEMQQSRELASILLQNGKRITQYAILRKNDELPAGYELFDSFRRESRLLWRDGKAKNSVDEKERQKERQKGAVREL